MYIWTNKRREKQQHTHMQQANKRNFEIDRYMLFSFDTLFDFISFNWSPKLWIVSLDVCVCLTWKKKRYACYKVQRFMVVCQNNKKNCPHTYEFRLNENHCSSLQIRNIKKKFFTCFHTIHRKLTTK